MARATRIRISAWPAALWAIAALSCGASGCELDSRQFDAAQSPGQGVDDGGGPDAPHPRGPDAPDGSNESAAGSDADLPVPVAGSSGSSSAGDSGGGTSGSGGAMEDAGTDAGPSPEGGTTQLCHKLEFSSQWIDDFSNCLEIQGEAWADSGFGGLVFNSHLESEPICMADAAPTDGPASLGFTLNQADREATPADYDARQHEVVGFRFQVFEYVGGLPFPFVGVESQGEIYCTELAGSGDHEIFFTDLRARCWESSSGSGPDPEHIRSLLFYYPADYPGEPIGMCFSDMFAIVEIVDPE